jgi:hypothetical protein
MDMEVFPGNLFPQSMLALHAVFGSILILKLLLHWKENLCLERTRFRRCFL